MRRECQLLLLLVALLLLSTTCSAAFKSARYRQHMAVGADGEDERVTAQKLNRRQVPSIADPIPPLLPKSKVSRSYHYNYGPRYPTHHKHMQNQVFPPAPNELLYP
jgi:hypothetical protein